MKELSQQNVVVGVTGGIAAYKMVDIVSQLRKAGFNVHVIMTANATQFINPLTFQTISQNPVIVDLFETPSHWEVQHISAADKADLFLIAPASANIIGKIANGIADDMLSTTVMATTAPVLIAPAMNVHMYENEIVQQNIKRLKTLGYQFIEPEFGRLACGYEGKGRLASNDTIVNRILEFNSLKDLQGQKVLITAGPTREHIDPVRFLSNPSTGKMGYALASQARKRGAEVTLISGPSHLPDPDGVHTVRIQTAQQMYESVLDYEGDADIIIGAAAVADYRPVQQAAQKIKKTQDELTLTLAKNPDILGEIGKHKHNRILVGFAAETHEPLKYGAEKLIKKNLDLIVINDVSDSDAGFAVDTNRVMLMDVGGNKKKIELASKQQIAVAIWDHIIEYLINKEA